MSTWQRSTSVWRTGTSQLKQAGRDDYPAICNALEVLQANHATSTDPPESDVCELFTVAAQHLSSSHEQPGHVSSSGLQAEQAYCRLLSSVLTSSSSSKKIKMLGSAATIVCSALRQWSNPVHEHRAAGAQAHGLGSSMTDSLQLEALAALGLFLQDNLQQVAEHERAAVTAVLLSLAQPPDSLPAVIHTTPPASPRTTASQGSGSQAHAMHSCEVQRLAIHALAACFGRATAGGGAAAGAGLSADALAQLQAALLATLQVCCAGSARVVEAQMHARFYATLLRALGAVITEGKKAWVPHTALLVECLRKFLRYGVPAAAGPQGPTTATHSEPAPSPTAQAPQPGGKARYCPPHLRTQRSDSGTASRMSDSDVSDTEGPAQAAPADRFKSSKVRLAVCACLQSMAKADSRAMHSHWTTLLPVQQPLQPKPLTPHLVTMLLHDPLPKVRSMAAATICSLVEGPAARGFLAVAEARAASSSSARATPARGFVTLSASLGQMVVSLHAGLVHAVSHEGATFVLAGVLRALCVLISAAPVERLPPQLLPTALGALRARWAALIAPGAAGAGAAAQVHAMELNTLQAAYLACIAEAMSIKQPVASLTAYLSPAAAAAGKGQQASGSSADGLVPELLAACVHPQPTVRIEALAALKGLAAHYVFVMEGQWEAVKEAVVANLHELPGTAPTLRRNSSFGGGKPAAAAGGADGGSWGAGKGQPTSPGAYTPAKAHDRGPSSSGAGPSTADDKAMQHAVKLLGEYLAATGKQHGMGPDASQQFSDSDVGGPPPVAAPGAMPPHKPAAAAGQVSGQGDSSGAVAKQLAGWWQEGLGILLPVAKSHVSDMVRAAAVGVWADLSQPIFEHLPPDLQLQVVLQAAQSATKDSAAAVRAAGCKVLGACCSLPPVRDSAQASAAVLAALSTALQDSVMSVRIAACWALALMCEGMQQLLAPAAGGSSASVRAHHLSQLQGLAQCAVSAAQGDADKVRANGARAVGALLGCMSPQLASDAHIDIESWLEGTLAVLQSCMTTGNMRVQWSACVAAEALLSNAQLMAMPHAVLRVGPILLLLVMLVRDSANFKIRMHAASALAAPRARALYGRCFTDALLVVCGVIDSLAAGSTAAAAGTGGEGAAAGSGSGGPAAPAAGGGSTGAGTGAGGDEASRNFPNFRYLAALMDQLRSTLLHLLALASSADADQARDALTRRTDIMRRTLEGIMWSALRDVAPVADSVPGVGSSSDIAVAGQASGDDALRLPADPFLPTAESPTSPHATVQAMVDRVHMLAASSAGGDQAVQVLDVHQVLVRVQAAGRGLLQLMSGLPQASPRHRADLEELVQALRKL